MNVRMRALPSVAHTQHDYARMLLTRNAPGDGARAAALLNQARVAAQDMGMMALAERSNAVQTAIGLPS